MTSSGRGKSEGQAITAFANSLLHFNSLSRGSVLGANAIEEPNLLMSRWRISILGCAVKKEDAAPIPSAEHERLVRFRVRKFDQRPK